MLLFLNKRTLSRSAQNDTQ